MKKLALTILLIIPGICGGGDEYQIPELIDGSGYESDAPKFTVVGRQHIGEIRVWVVAQQEIVLSQSVVNRVIKSIKRAENDEVSQITFYTSVHSKPKYPAFRIFEHLGLYISIDNNTYFGVAAKEYYGGWSYGPQ